MPLPVASLGEKRAIGRSVSGAGEDLAEELWMLSERFSRV